MNIIYILLSSLIAYLLGCFSTGLFVAKKKHIALRELGSKSTGATNVIRVIGFKYGVLTFLGDFLKGAVSILLVRFIFGYEYAYFAALFCVIGHNWPVFYGFKGGKGIAVSCAVLLFTVPAIALLAIIVTLLVIYFTKYVSLGSLTLLALSFVLSIVFSKPAMEIGLCFALLLLGTYRHRANIERLLQGKENKLNLKK